MRMPAIALIALLASCATTQSTGEGPRAGSHDAATLHARLLTLDTHLDTPINFGREGWRFDAAHDIANDLAQVDGGRMRTGALDGGFFVVYTEQGPLTAQGYADALAFARGRSDLIDRTIGAFPSLIGPAHRRGRARS